VVLGSYIYYARDGSMVFGRLIDDRVFATYRAQGKDIGT